jgi:hypothetical protein
VVIFSPWVIYNQRKSSQYSLDRMLYVPGIGDGVEKRKICASARN